MRCRVQRLMTRAAVNLLRTLRQLHCTLPGVFSPHGIPDEL